jgi:hypothetical protein
MHDYTYFWQIVTVGVFAFTAELVFLFWTIRGWRAGHGAHSTLWPVMLAVTAALVLPALVVVLVSGGRPAFNEGPQWPRLERMTEVWNQRDVLFLGTSVGFPSIVVAGITTGLAVSRREGRIQRILFCSAAPTILAPFFAGIWLFIDGLPDRLIVRSSPYPALASVLAVAKQRLEVGMLVAGLVLATFFALLVIQLVKTKNNSLAVEGRSWRNTVVAMVMLAVAAILGWLPGPLVAENLTPVPGHDSRISERTFPAVPAGLAQDELYDRSANTLTDDYYKPLRYPLVARKQDALVLSGPHVEISRDSVFVNSATFQPQELFDELVHARSNDRELYKNKGVRSAMIMAPPDLPLDMVADALAVVYDVGDYEVRLVTGLPETIQRPALGPLTRIILQSTTIALARSKDIDPQKQQRVLPVSKGGRRYRDLLDQVFKLGNTSSPPIILLDREHSWRCNGRTP